MNRSANVGLAELSGKSNTTTYYYSRSNAQVSHHRVVDRATRVVKEDIDPFGARFLHGRGKVIRFFVIYSRIEPDLPTPLKLVFPSSNGHGTTACQLRDLANKLANRA
jgi:hypothetical protein